MMPGLCIPKYIRQKISSEPEKIKLFTYSFENFFYCFFYSHNIRKSLIRVKSKLFEKTLNDQNNQLFL